MITVQLRWIVSSNSEFPFQWTLPEDTTIEKLCKMVIDKNNLWHGNPRFSVVKIYGDDMFKRYKKSFISYICSWIKKMKFLRKYTKKNKS